MWVRWFVGFCIFRVYFFIMIFIICDVGELKGEEEIVVLLVIKEGCSGNKLVGW